MDAASFLDIFRSSVLGVAFVSNAVLMADPPPCKTACSDTVCALGCETPCSSCQTSQEPVVAVTCTVTCSDEACCEERTVEGSAEEFSVQTLAHWMGRLLSTRPKITARLAVHGVVPELKLDSIDSCSVDSCSRHSCSVVACGHKICVGGKCYDVDDDAVEGKACDQEARHEVIQESEEPIVEVPAAPPLPPSYQFTSIWTDAENDSDADPTHEALQTTRVEVPVSTLVSLMVANAEASTRIELTQEMMAQQREYSEQMLAVVERNAQLRTQLAVMEARQQYSDLVAFSLAERAEFALQTASNPSCSSADPVDSAENSKTESGMRMTAIQEDLANIRRQIALLKRHSPVPFAPSYVGSLDVGQETINSYRTARAAPYIPVSPVDCASQKASTCDSPEAEGNSSVK